MAPPEVFPDVNEHGRLPMSETGSVGRKVDPARWFRSPLRGPWLTSVFACVLLVGIPIVSVTGLLSYAAYNPRFGGSNQQTPDAGLLGFYLFDWPTNPTWLYRVTQGLHVG